MKITKVETIVRTPFISLEKRSYIDTNNNENEWYMVSRNGNRKAVVIVALVESDGLEDNKLVVTREFRVPIGDYEWGLPAGLIDEEEDVEETVRRELKEETGLDVTLIERVSPFVYSSAGLTDESVAMAFVYAEGKVNKELLESSEDIETFLLTPEEVAELLSQEDLKFGAKAWVIMDNFARTGQI